MVGTGTRHAGAAAARFREVPWPVSPPTSISRSAPPSSARRASPAPSTTTSSRPAMSPCCRPAAVLPSTPAGGSRRPGRASRHDAADRQVSILRDPRTGYRAPTALPGSSIPIAYPWTASGSQRPSGSNVKPGGAGASSSNTSRRCAGAPGAARCTVTSVTPDAISSPILGASRRGTQPSGTS